MTTTAQPPATAQAPTAQIFPVQIHFDDLDALGMVHNARYALFVERAITAYWVDRGWSYTAERTQYDDTFLAVREFRIEYLAPILGAGDAAVHIWIEHLGRTSIVYGFRLLSADHATVHASGRRAQVKLDPATLRPSPLSDALRAAAIPLMDTDAIRPVA
ncbi:thioesterase family protein [Streptomyces sp. SPB162]|uniref:acyl-CoA thioesterase n=1 Tax=Streptomyces sp. SPB162 TaxID=2940560 RepID=UPI0024066E4B|nr:thioesterase family protein [Streptomyces sp. SPB162]MDF9815792.1 acyl-CoA thioester hydrolase [Streptomyces sp. SPB162]